ncbi:MAG: hemolysin family protein [Roseiflexaceae bacterium]
MELLIILLLIVLNGVFAMAEMAVVSARKVRLQQWAEAGDAKARVALELAEEPTSLLSTVQIGITLIGILAGAFGGATVAHMLATQLNAVPLLAPYSEAIGFGIVVLITTYLSLVVGELLPKRLALNNPERIAVAVARPMRFLSKLASPAVWLLTFSTDALLRLLRVRPSTEPPVTEEEIKVLLEQGAEAGVFAEAEQEMIERVFRLGDLRVGMVMTPRTQMVWLDLDDPVEQNLRKILASPYAAFPVGRGTPDKIRGVVYAKDLLARVLTGQPIDLQAAVCPALFVPESMAAFRALHKFRETRSHLALVVDEYGGVDGLVTLTDLVEELVGDMPDLGETGEQAVVQREDGSWLVSGRLPIDELKELLGVEYLPGEEAGRYHTLGGFVLTQLGHMPSVSEHFDWGGLRFEVVDMDGPRIDKVLVAPISAALTEQSSA